MIIKELQKTFVERLSDLMKEREFKTISDFSKQVNIPRTTISNWLNFVRNPQIDALVTIAIFFDVSTDYLLGLTENGY